MSGGIVDRGARETLSGAVSSISLGKHKIYLPIRHGDVVIAQNSLVAGEGRGPPCDQGHDSIE